MCDKEIRKGIIFDLDGTLWDASDNVNNIWIDVIRKHAPWMDVTLDLVVSVCGMEIDEIGRFLFPDKDDSFKKW